MYTSGEVSLLCVEVLLAGTSAYSSCSKSREGFEAVVLQLT